ncbi:MAG: GNAT family N-acetyltransferase [Solirubrobacteraceae bacterium]|nr:GNAT family N-acetyltransferase [Solirubrobacteraceae bacterium]
MSPAPGPGAIRLRTATAGDAGAVAALHRASILRGCVGDYSATQIRAWLAVLTPAVYPELIASTSFRIALEDDAVCGFAATTVSEEVINAVYVAPFAMGKGVGQALVADAEEALMTAGRHEARLNATLNAVEFYRWMGYVDVGHASNRLSSGVAMACVAMRKPLV